MHGKYMYALYRMLMRRADMDIFFNVSKTYIQCLPLALAPQFLSSLAPCLINPLGNKNVIVSLYPFEKLF